MIFMLKFDEKSVTISYPLDFLPKEIGLCVTLQLNHLKERECKGEGMDNIDNIDIFNAAKYIVCLHYKADKQYTCNRTKIDKLLAIADLVFIRHSKRLFPNQPIYINGCGIGYRILATNSYLFPIDNMINGDSRADFSDNLVVILSDDNREVPSMYSVSLPDGPQRKVLEDVFCRFGAYTAKLIGSTMDEFKGFLKSDMSCDTDSNDEVNVERANVFFTHGNDLLKTNVIAKFIAEYTPMI